jgi:hypothetical protein
VRIKLIGLSRDKDLNQDAPYELNVNTNDIICLYKDKYGCYISTIYGRLYRVDHSISDLESFIK